MPAKKQISKETIIETALNLVKERGMDSLNAREIAVRCNCSTQPIYLSFKNIGELKAELHKQIVETYYKYIRDEVASGKYPEYKGTGMGYIRFAKEQKEFFKHLFMRNRDGEKTIDEDSGFKDEVFKIMQSIGLYHDKAVTLHTHMWVWVHGIATMYATGYLNWEWDTVSAMLTDAFFGIKQRLDEKDGKQ